MKDTRFDYQRGEFTQDTQGRPLMIVGYVYGGKVNVIYEDDYITTTINVSDLHPKDDIVMTAHEALNLFYNIRPVLLEQPNNTIALKHIPRYANALNVLRQTILDYSDLLYNVQLLIEAYDNMGVNNEHDPDMITFKYIKEKLSNVLAVIKTVKESEPKKHAQ